MAEARHDAVEARAKPAPEHHAVLEEEEHAEPRIDQEVRDSAAPQSDDPEVHAEQERAEEQERATAQQERQGREEEVEPTGS